jgi:hypothetical protein
LNIEDLWDNREPVLFAIQVLLFIVQLLSLGFLALYVYGKHGKLPLQQENRLKAVLERMPGDSRYAFSRDNKNRMDNIIGQLLVIASNYPVEADSRDKIKTDKNINIG